MINYLEVHELTHAFRILIRPWSVLLDNNNFVEPGLNVALVSRPSEMEDAVKTDL